MGAFLASVTRWQNFMKGNCDFWHGTNNFDQTLEDMKDMSKDRNTSFIKT